MKHGYVCQCGWRLKRGNLTRKQYAQEKRTHANGGRSTVFTGVFHERCEYLRKELMESFKAKK